MKPLTVATQKFEKDKVVLINYVTFQYLTVLCMPSYSNTTDQYSTWYLTFNNILRFFWGGWLLFVRGLCPRRLLLGRAMSVFFCPFTIVVNFNSFAEIRYFYCKFLAAALQFRTV